MKRNTVVSLYALFALAYVGISLLKGYTINDYSAYSWSEIFINYEAGFIRRGLLGQFLYATAQYMDARITASLLYTVALFAFLYFSHKYLRESFDDICLYFVFLSPALYLFFLKEYQIFAMKDMYILLSVFYMFFLAKTSIGRQNLTVYGLTGIFLCIYAVAFLIHEMAIFYFPLPFLVLGIAYYHMGRLKVWFLLGFAVELLSLYVASRYAGTTEQAQAIYSAWNTLYPEFKKEDAGAILYIGRDFTVWLQEVARHLSSGVTVASIVITCVMAALPVALIAVCYKSCSATLQNMPSTLLRWLIIPALLAPFIPLSFAQDFGRFIAHGFLSVIFFLGAMQRLSPQKTPTRIRTIQHRIKTSATARVAVLLFTLAYSFGWAVINCPFPGGSIIREPYLFILLQKHVLQ
ncbi:MAG: hypothetical protein LBQ10_06600 [Desulfovibrio sp.]|nr:hypothetical protein [Desulfovibrio sp.]